MDILVILTPVAAKHCRWMFVFVQDFPINGSNYAEIRLHYCKTVKIMFARKKRRQKLVGMFNLI